MCSKWLLSARHMLGLYMGLFSPSNNWSTRFPRVAHKESETQRGEVSSLQLISVPEVSLEPSYVVHYL